MKLSRRIPLNTLRVFESAARLMSFTQAGEELGITQTAVSYQIKLLEEMIAQKLFLRRPRQLNLTEAGMQLKGRLGQAFGIIEEALLEASGRTNSVLTIHTNATFASRWLAAHIGTFQMENSDIAVRIELSQDLIDFSETEADIAIRAGTGSWPGLVSHFLMKGHFTPMLSPHLAETIGGVHEPADLLKLRLIDAGDPWWKIWFAEAGLPDIDLGNQPFSRLGAQAFEALAAIAGQGVAIINPDFYADEVASGRLFQPFDLVSSSGKDYWLVYPQTSANSRKIRAFCDFVRRTMPGFRE